MGCFEFTAESFLIPHSPEQLFQTARTPNRSQCHPPLHPSTPPPLHPSTPPPLHPSALRPIRGGRPHSPLVRHGFGAFDTAVRRRFSAFLTLNLRGCESTERAARGAPRLRHTAQGHARLETMLWRLCRAPVGLLVS